MKPFAWIRISNISDKIRGVFRVNPDGSAPDVELRTERLVPQYPDKPQPCPHCGVGTVRGWIEDDMFFIEHGEPLCRAGSKRLEVFPLTDHEIRVFHYWTLKAEPKIGES